MGQRLSLLIEPWLAFYDPDFAPPALLRSQPLRNRAGVEFEMKVRKLSNVGRDRNNRMWSRLETDPAYCDLARRIWTQGWQPLAPDTEATRQPVLRARAPPLTPTMAAPGKHGRTRGAGRG